LIIATDAGVIMGYHLSINFPIINAQRVALISLITRRYTTLYRLLTVVVIVDAGENLVPKPADEVAELQGEGTAFFRRFPRRYPPQQRQPQPRPQ
jgi:hypothetical protein